MKTLLIVTLVTLANLFPFGNVSSDSTTEKASLETVFTGSIVMEDDIWMLVDSGNPSEDIIQIDVYDQSEVLVKQVFGCDNPTCNVNLGDLDPGTYTVYAHPEFSYSFSDLVVVR